MKPDIYPRDDYEALGRYLPDRSPIAADLGDNRNLWGAHPAALAVMAEAGTAVASEYPDSYADELAVAVAAKFGTSPQNVTTGAGGTGVLDAVMRAVAPTRMRFMDPGWPAAGMLARMNGHDPVPVKWEDALDDPIRFAGSRPGIVYIANPGNPTGEAIPDDWIRAVYRHAEAVGSVLIIDEAYGEYHRSREDLTPFEMALEGERTLCVKTLSKAYGLAGMRAGYGVGSESLVLEVDKARGPFVVSGVTSTAAAAAVSSDSPWLEDTIAETKVNRERLLDCLNRRGYRVPVSAANFVFILRPDDRLEPETRQLESHGVRVRPFVGTTAHGSGLRATVAPWDRMRRLLDALDMVAARPV